MKRESDVSARDLEMEEPVAQDADSRRRGWRRWPGWVATMLGWMTLRVANWPGRQVAGWPARLKAKRAGARGFWTRSADGARLGAWYFPAKAGVQRRLPVVMLHGWLEIKEFHFPRAKRLAGNGHDVILFDHRGHGTSSYAVSTFGVREREDLTAVIDEAIRLELIQPPVITAGFSMGAATVIQQAGNDKRVAGVVAFAPFAELPDAILSFRDRLAPWMRDRWLLAGFRRAVGRLGFTLEEASCVTPMRELSKPVLLIEATKDRNLPPEQHIKPLVEVKTHGRLECFSTEGATHMNICRRKWDGLDDAVEAFCRSVEGRDV